MTSAASKITIRLRICLAVNCVIIMEFHARGEYKEGGEQNIMLF